MRMQILIAATLASCGCTSMSSTDDCTAESENFTVDLDLDATTVQDLLTASGASDPAKLDCDQVCTDIYQRDQRPNWEVSSIATCGLTIDGELMGNPTAIIGNLRCEGGAVEYYCLGRRPLGHIEQAPAGPDLPAFLAHCAHLEAASVLAFAELAERLSIWGAPAALVDRCRQAAAEEAEHAQILGALAREAGAAMAAPSQRSLPVDLADAALDNAIEGCVHEAWSALGCAVAARRAATPALRAAYARLAADEAGHAQLAWDLQPWFMGQVSPLQRAAIIRAQGAAIAGLPALARAQGRAAPPAIGLPGARVAAHFAAGLAAAA